MKKTFIGLVCSVLFGCVLFVNLLPSQNNNYSNDSEAIHSNIRDLEQEYGSSLCLALFSLPDFRSYSIITFDKTSKMYGENWISPNLFCDVLNFDEKKTLLESTIKNIEKIPGLEVRTEMIGKIKKWCVANSQFQHIANRMAINRSMLMRSFTEIPETEIMIRNLHLKISTASGEFDLNEYDRMYFAVVNHLSNYSNKEQMLYYSNLYKNLSCIVQN